MHYLERTCEIQVAAQGGGALALPPQAVIDATVATAQGVGDAASAASALPPFSAPRARGSRIPRLKARLQRPSRPRRRRRRAPDKKRAGAVLRPAGLSGLGKAAFAAPPGYA